MLTLAAVVAAMVVLPVAAVWWSCRVAPPVKRRPVLFRRGEITVRFVADVSAFTEAIRRAGASAQECGEAMERFRNQWRQSP